MSSDTTPAPSFATASITQVGAAALVAAAIAAAGEIGFAPAVAVTDPGGHLKAFERTDGAPFLTAMLAIDKAWTASSFGFPTHVWNALIGDPVNAPLGQYGRVVAVGGGFPLRATDGQVIGGIGVSGGSVAQDQQAAEQALTTVGFAFTG